MPTFFFSQRIVFASLSSVARWQPYGTMVTKKITPFQRNCHADVRVTTIIGYILFFRRLENSLPIVRIVHGARDYDKLFD